MIRHLCILFAVLLPAAIAESPEQLFFNYKPPGYDSKLRFRLVKLKQDTPQSPLEVLAYFQEQRSLMVDSERLAFYGKDINNDGFIDTWMFRDDYFISNIFRFTPKFHSPNDVYGTNGLVEALNHEFKIKNRSIVAMSIINSGKFLTMAISNSEAAKEDYAQNQVQLYELRERALRLPPGEHKNSLLQIFEEGWKKNNDELIEKTKASTYWRTGAGDLAITYAVIKVFKWVGNGGKWLVQKASTTTVGKVVSASSKKVIDKTKAHIITPLILKTGLNQLTYAQLKPIVQHEIRKLTYQSTLAKTVLKLLGKEAGRAGKNGGIQVFQAYKNGLTGWDYIAQTQFMQLLAEANTRWDEIYDPNPIVLTENLVTDKDFIQNFAYMTNETTVLSGILRGDEPLKRKLKICGTVAIINSTAMNLLIKDEVEPTRVALDMGWELTFGIGQTYLDTEVIKYFKNKNPKLKIVGMVIAMADQAAGYWLYSHATQKLEAWNDDKKQKSHESIKIIPVLAPLP